MIHIVKYGAEWCVPCKKYDPELDKIIAEGYYVERIDIDEAGDQAAGITSIPYTEVYVNGVLAESFTGAKPYAFLKQLIGRYDER